MTHESLFHEHQSPPRSYLMLAVAGIPILLMVMLWWPAPQGPREDLPVAGRYNCTGTDDRRNRYEITLQVRARDEGFLLLWSEDNGRVSARGIGMRDGSKLAVSFTNGRAIGVANYAIGAGALTGRWWGGQGSILTETCQRGDAREARR